MNRLKNSLPVIAAIVGLYMATLQLVPKMPTEVTALAIVGAAVVGLAWPQMRK